MLAFYSLGIWFYYLVIHLAAPFVPSAKKWINGRKNNFDRIAGFRKNGKTIWIHCASLGEFEQARPLIERLKAEKNVSIILTFFSPSGYEIRKNYSHADLVVYLPIDLPSQVRRFLDLTQPDMIFFVKYEFWFNYINEAGKRKIPLFLVSGLFRKDHYLLKFPGKSLLKYFRNFEHFYLQDHASATLLNENGFMNTTVAGDTRFDRVMEIAANSKEILLVQNFTQGCSVLVAGSTWKQDEEILLKTIEILGSKGIRLKLVIAPHHIEEEVIRRLTNAFPSSSLFSKGNPGESDVLIIDNIGMLSSLYKYGQAAYVGGGFGKAVHNVLEPAAHGVPVFFGPENQKFREIQMMKERSIGFEITTAEELADCLFPVYADPEKRNILSQKTLEFMKSNSGAVEMILKDILSSI